MSCTTMNTVRWPATGNREHSRHRPITHERQQGDDRDPGVQGGHHDDDADSQKRQLDQSADVSAGEVLDGYSSPVTCFILGSEKYPRSF